MSNLKNNSELIEKAVAAQLNDYLVYNDLHAPLQSAHDPWHSTETALIGTLSNDDDDGSENVSKKMKLLSFKLNRVYLDPLNMSNAGDFSWS